MHTLWPRCVERRIHKSLSHYVSDRNVQRTPGNSPPVKPWATTIIGAAGSRFSLKGGVKSTPIVPPSGRRINLLRKG